MQIFSGITFRLNSFIIGLVVLSTIGISIVGNTLSSASFEDHMRNVTFPALMDTIMGTVDRELIAPAQALELTTKNPFFIAWVAEGGNEAQVNQVFALGREIVNMYHTTGLNVVLWESLRFFSLDQQTESVFITNKERDSWFFAFQESGKPLWVNLHAANDPIYPGMAFFNRRIDLNGKFAGVVSTGMKIETVINKLSEMRIGKHGVTMLVRSNGSLLAHTDSQVVGKSLQELPGYAKMAANISKDRVTKFEYVNPLGEYILVMMQYIPVLDLFLVSEANLDELLSDMNKAKWYSMGIGLIFIILGGAVGYFLIRTITNPLKIIMVVAETLTQRGKSNTDLPPAYYSVEHRKDELGVLARTLGAMIISLQDVSALAQKESAKAQEESTRVKEAMLAVATAKKEAEERTYKFIELAKRLAIVAEIVSTATISLEEYVQTADHGARIQVDNISETATAMTEMTRMVLKVAQNASVASEASNITRQRAENGATVVRRAVASIKQVQEQSVALKTDMGQLEQSAQAITQIMGVISDIADQTNLLALNAAIEAARAGEAGRGFAVVADEVRKLAEKTMSSTINVSHVINDIQQRANNSLIRMDEAVQSIEEATLQATESGTALNEIVSLVDDTADQVHAIATAAKEQSTTSEQINLSIGQVNDTSRNTAQAMHKASQAVAELTRQAHDLSKLIDEMKTS